MCFLLPFLFTWCAGWGAGASSCEPAGASEGAGIVPTPHRLHGTIGTAAGTFCSRPPKLADARPDRGAGPERLRGAPAGQAPRSSRPGPSRRPAPPPDAVPAAARSGPSAALLRADTAGTPAPHSRDPTVPFLAGSSRQRTTTPGRPSAPPDVTADSPPLLSPFALRSLCRPLAARA